jgi:hypothetical protein
VQRFARDQGTDRGNLKTKTRTIDKNAAKIK